MLRHCRRQASVVLLYDVFLAPLFFLVLSYSSHAQQVTGNLQGRLLDSLGRAVSNANIVVRGPNVQGMRGKPSDEEGYFTLHALPTGIVSVSVTHVQYQPVIFENVSVELGRTTNLGEVRLQSRSHDLPEIVVSGNRPFIDPNTTSSGTNLRSSDFEKLPIERNYRSIATLIPQANASYFGDEVNVAGGTGRETKYFVDGVDVSDWHFGRIETNLPYNFVKEIQVTTSGYEAEYRSSLGGLVNVVTHSGGNEVHGSVFGFYASDWLAAQPRVGLLDPTQGAFSNYDAGGSIGFPIVQNELWMYGAYNPTFSLREVDLPGLGTRVDKSVTHTFAGKLTWRPSQQLDLVLTSFGDPSKRTAIGDIPLPPPVALENPDPYLVNVRQGGINYSVNGSYMINERVLLDASISRIVHNEIREPSTERGKNEILFIDTTGKWSGGSFGPFSFFRHSTSSRLSATFVSASHTLKAGIEYRDHAVEADVNRQRLTRVNDTLYIQLVNRNLATVHNRIPSVFFQDSWQVAHGLRLHAGVRWDGQFLIATNGTVAQRITDQFQPRVGFVFMIDDDESHKVSGSFGRFTQELHTVLSQFYHSDQGYFYIIRYRQDPRTGSLPGDTVVNQPLRIEPEVPGLKGQYYDEFSLGYERMLSEHLKISIQGIHRTLREAIDDGWISSEGRLRLGNPGRGVLSDFPRAQRDYTALAITVEQRGDPLKFIASYVLSRNYGNYPGLFDAYFPLVGGNTSFAFDDIGALRHATGLLPNDRTHVFKFSGFYRLNFGLVAGTSFTWQSGTPLSEWAGSADGLEWFLAPRGTAGRTPAIWDLSARFIYDLRQYNSLQPRLILDVFHIGSPRRPVNIVQEQFKSVDQSGNGAGLNPDYGKAYRYQPPMSVRFGMELIF